MVTLFMCLGSAYYSIVLLLLLAKCYLFSIHCVDCVWCGSLLMLCGSYSAVWLSVLADSQYVLLWYFLWLTFSVFIIVIDLTNLFWYYFILISNYSWLKWLVERNYIVSDYWHDGSHCYSLCVWWLIIVVTVTHCDTPVFIGDRVA